jgi:plasmid maintenance system killer protein
MERRKDGNYSIVVNINPKLLFSYVGYKSQSITIGEENYNKYSP